MSIYVPPISEPQIRRLYFRNLSQTDVVVKLVSTKPHVLELARNRLRLEPDSYLFIEAKFSYANLGICDVGATKLIGYAMPVYTHTLPAISKWFDTDGSETNKQLAFEMQVIFSNSVFSARDIIIDLPGTACLVDSVPRSIPSLNGNSPVDEVDADTKTAVTFTMNRDIVCNLCNTEERKGSWIRDLINSPYNPFSASRSNSQQSTMRTAKLNTGSSFSSYTAIENMNIEQEATPCGGN
uniref:Vesicle-fusing ATPase n=1 Tax=Haemonchus contortus TaxID=6289 RepID=A0A7I4Y828_HAECO